MHALGGCPCALGIHPTHTALIKVKRESDFVFRRVGLKYIRDRAGNKRPDRSRSPSKKNGKDCRMRTNKKPTTGSSATKKVITPVAMPPSLVPLAPKTTAHLAPATPEAKPSVVPPAPALLAVPVTPLAPEAKAVSPSEREKLIEFEAYLLAEKNNFQGDPADYWRRGEALVAANLGRNDGPAGQGAHGTSLGNWGGRLT